MIFPYFIRRISGYQILIGPDAVIPENSPYLWCFTLNDHGKFTGYSRTRLTPSAVRTAKYAASELGLPGDWERLK